MSALAISERDIRRHGPAGIMALWRQWRTERRLVKRGIRFRSTAPAQVAAAYAAMDPAEFDAINAPQAWANWRTIPRALSGNIPDRPLRGLDLGCGAGSSTQVLAHYCPAGSHLTGYEIAESMLDIARRRGYRHRNGDSVQVDFVCQPITDPLRLPDGTAITDGSVDFVSASGVVGHHLTVETIAPLLAEMKRVLKCDGAAFLDVGPTLAADSLRAVMTAAGFTCVGHHRSWFGDRTGQIVFRR